MGQIKEPPKAGGPAKPTKSQMSRFGASTSAPRRTVPVILVVGVAALLLIAGAILLTRQPTGSSGQPPAVALTPISNLQASDYHSLVVDPKDADRVWFGSHTGIQESTNGGHTWTPLAGMSGDAMSMSWPVSDATTVYIAGHNVFKRSTDGGRSWQDVRTDLSGTDLHGFAVDPANGKHLLALVVGAGLHESTDGGDHWQPVPAQPPGATGALAVALGNSPDPPTLYAMTGLGVMRSQDAGKSWHPANGELPQGQDGVRALLSVPGKTQELYAGTSNGLYHTNDAGSTWQQTVLVGRDIIALAASQSGTLRVYALAADGAVFRLEGTTLGSTQ